jgi:hypothetical protein
MPGPDVPAIAIGIMKKKGMAPPGDKGPGEETDSKVTPDQLDAASDVGSVLGIPPERTEALAKALCNFMDIYNSPHDEPDGDEGAEPSDASEAG